MKNEKLLLFLLALIQFTNIVDFMIIMPLGPSLMKLFNMEPKEFGVIVSSYAIAAFVSAVAGTMFMDRFDRKKALLAIYIGFAVGTLACGLAPNFFFLVVARSLTGLFGGVLGGLVLSIVGDVIPAERRAAAMGQVMAAFSVASVLGIPFGLYISGWWGWHAPFFLLAGMAVIVTVLIIFYVPSITVHMERKSAQAKSSSVLDVFSNISGDPNQLRALLLMILLVLGMFTIAPYIATSMVANVGFREDQLFYIYFFGGALTIFTSPVIGKLADRYGKHKVFFVFALLSLIPVYIITHLGITPLPVALAVTTFFFVVANGRMVPAMTMITSTVHPQNRGSFMSAITAVQHLSSGLASFVAGLIIVRSSTGQLLNFEYVGYIAIAAGALSLLVARQLKSVEAGTQEPGKKPETGHGVMSEF